MVHYDGGLVAFGIDKDYERWMSFVWREINYHFLGGCNIPERELCSMEKEGESEKWVLEQS